MKCLIVAILFAVVQFACTNSNAGDLKKQAVELQTGDIIFQSSKSGQSLAVQLATHSRYSHVGMIIKHEGSLQVIEAVQPVMITPLKQWICLLYTSPSPRD